MLSLHYSQKLLNLSGILIKDIKNDGHTTTFYIECPRKPHKCPCCGHATSAIHDYRNQTIKDLPSFGNNTLLVLRKRRYVCTQCGKRFYETTSFLPRYYRHTTRLALYVLTLLTSTHSFTSVAHVVNLSVSTIIRIFDKLSYAPSELPQVLSIDEFKGNTGGEKYQCIITDPAHRRVIDILPNRFKSHLTSYFLSFDTTKTTHFISDMWQNYRDLSNEIFPQATFVVDKYHYIRQVIWAFEAIRKEVQKEFTDYRRKYFKHSKRLLLKHFDDLNDDQKQQVNTMLYTSIKLANAYTLKEQFYTFIASEDYSTAKNLLQNWIQSALASELSRFIECAKTMLNWQQGILNTFKTPYTNSYTEGINNKIKVLKRNAFGYRNFKRFRNRILHICN